MFNLVGYLEEHGISIPDMSPPESITYSINDMMYNNSIEREDDYDET